MGAGCCAAPWPCTSLGAITGTIDFDPGSGFGLCGEGYFRISAFNSRANVEEVARRFKALSW